MNDKHQDIDLSGFSSRGQQGAEHWFGSLHCFDKPRRRFTQWFWVAVICAGIAIGVFAL